MISVVIPTYNEEKDIKGCLESLRKQSFKDFEIIVVDDGSTDKTTEIVKKYKVKLIKGEHKGPGFSRNIGAREAKGEILIFIDADMSFHKEYLKNLIAPIKGEVIGTTHDYEVAVNTKNKWSFLWGKIRVDENNVKDVPIFRAIRKDKFLEMGGFDPKYSYADDQTFWFKYKIKPVIAKNSTCYHKNPESLKSTFKQARWIGASWKERYLIFKIPILNYLTSILFFPVFPFFAIARAFSKKREDISFSDKLSFYLVKFLGFGNGLLRAVYLSKFEK
jgi:glycosyltransferase involved in cell wall biosynthesis